jgi:hypothetical protein
VPGTEVEKKFYFVQNLGDLQRQLTSLETDLSAALLAEDIEPHVLLARVELTKVSQWVTWVARMDALQPLFMRLKMVFTTARLSKNFTAHMTDFAAVDELWKTVVHRARDPVRQNLCDVLDLPRFGDLLEHAETAAQRLEAALDEYMSDLRRKWAKLYLLDRDALLHALCTADLWTVFAKCGRALLPAVSQVHFDSIDRSTTVACECHGELIAFPSAISASRIGFIDWMRMLETGLDEKLVADMLAFRQGKKKVIEDAINPKCSDQARLAALQVQLWMEFDQTTHKTSNERREKIMEVY